MEERKGAERTFAVSGHEAEAAEFLRTEMTFLAENPESFGLISDARPLATKHLLVAANGHSTDVGVNTPTFELEFPGVDGLLALYGDMLRDTEDLAETLQAAFGEIGTAMEHPVSRYCAVLAEVTAMQVLRGPAGGASFEQTKLMLDDAVCKNLATLRHYFTNDEIDLQEEDFFEVSLGVCRLREEGDGDYVADVFAAGDFHMYLLDEQGMAPLWRIATSAISPDSHGALRGKSIRFRHPEPFAVLLLSDSVCALNAAEHRGLKTGPGLIWRYRMRLEDYFLRLVTDCVREYEFGERATRFFLGRSHGWDSASGAMTVLRNGVSYEVFRLRCQNRLSALGRLVELLPNGYDATAEPEPESRTEVELAFLRRQLEKNADLSDALSDALRRSVLDTFTQAEDAEVLPPPRDVPDYRRLSREEIRAVFRTFDEENDGDRARIDENNRMIRESLSEHWITLRPVLIETALSSERPVAVYREAANRAFDACLEMNSRLSGMLAHRHALITRLENRLADSLDVLDAEGNDWICGRAGADRAALWVGDLTASLPALLAELSADWEEDTHRYRSLLAAYTTERERLFRLDVRPTVGGFAADWRAMLDGCLPEARWTEYRERLEASVETASFVPLLESLRRISMGTGALLSRIRARSAEARTARKLSGDADLRVSALRGAAYEDPAWGTAVIDAMDTATRNEFRATVRRWQETCRLLSDRREAFTAYSDMYHTYQ